MFCGRWAASGGRVGTDEAGEGAGVGGEAGGGAGVGTGLGAGVLGGFVAGVGVAARRIGSGSEKSAPTGVFSSSSIGGRSPAGAIRSSASGIPRSSSPSRSSVERASGGAGVGRTGDGIERGGPGARPGAEGAAAPSPYRTESALNTSLVTALSVSSTPTPFTAIAS